MQYKEPLPLFGPSWIAGKLASGRPLQGIDQQLLIFFVLEIVGISQRRIEHASRFESACPRYGLGRIGHGASQQHLDIVGDLGVLIDLAGRREVLDILQNRMLRVGVDNLDLNRIAPAVVAMVVAAENLAIQRKPVLERMTGSADANDRSTRQAIFLDVFELLASDFQSLGEEHHDIGGVEGFQPRQIVGLTFSPKGPWCIPPDSATPRVFGERPKISFDLYSPLPDTRQTFSGGRLASAAARASPRCVVFHPVAVATIPPVA